MTSRTRKQQGIALVSVLVLMVMLVLAAIVSMRTTTLDLKMAKNSRDKSVAFQIASGTATGVDNILEDYLFNRGWDGVNMPANLLIADRNRVLYDTNVAQPFSFNTPENPSDLRYVDSGNLLAEIYISRVEAALSSGTGAALGEGYSGLGRGAAGGGGSLFFDISSNSFYVNNSSSLVGGYYRITIRN